MELSSSSQNFLVLIASFSFALFASARAVESLQNFANHEEDFKHLDSMLLNAVGVIIVSMLPLILSEIDNFISLSSYMSFVISSILLVNILYSIQKRNLKFHYKTLSYSLIGISTLISFSYLYNAIYSKSIIVFLMLLFIGFVLLCYRYYLVLGHFVKIKKAFLNKK